jgi:hypothetical protein
MPAALVEEMNTWNVGEVELDEARRGARFTIAPATL